MNKQNIKGITLIALVITIIVLLILAGVSIAMLTGPNGLITQANEAKIKTDEAGAKEKVQIAVAGSWGENGFDAEKFEAEVGKLEGKITSGEEEFPIKVSVDEQNFEVSEEGKVTEAEKSTSGGDTVTPGEKITGSNKTYKKNGTAIIPVGFSIVPGLDDVSQGLVISDDENDTEVDKSNIVANGNQFVWIPVENAEKYKINTTYEDTLISQNTKNDIGYLPEFKEEEKMPEGSTEADKEKNLVISKKGFYISRYEAGDGSATTSGTERTNTSGTTGELVSKKDAYAYIWISQTDAKEKAKTFINTENVKSGLITGVQWDMAMDYLSKEPRLDGKGNEYIVTSANSNRHYLSGVKKTGKNETDRVCNIYDLEGNCIEFIAEKYTIDNSMPYVCRGGFYSSRYPASHRYSCNGDTNHTISFRFILYVM